MERKFRSSRTLVLALLALVAISGCDQLRARDKLNKGVEAYKAGQYDVAIQDFQEAKALDPNFMNARLYLAIAYANQYIPGAPSPENIRTGEQAIEEYKEVMNLDSGNLRAIDGIGSILYGMGATPFDPKKFAEAKDYYLKHIQLKNDDPAPYDWVGEIDWTLAFHANKEMRNAYNATAKKPIKDADPLPSDIAARFTGQYGNIVQEGIDYLTKAIQLKSDDANALAYLNLLLRQKADMETSAAARDADLKQADELTERVKTIKQQEMESPQPTS